MKGLQVLREEIDQLDEQLWEIIGQRTEVVRKVGEWKRQHGEPIVQNQRWEAVLQHCQDVAQKSGLSEHVVCEVMEILHKESVRVQS